MHCFSNHKHPWKKQNYKPFLVKSSSLRVKLYSGLIFGSGEQGTRLWKDRSNKEGQARVEKGCHSISGTYW